MMSGLGLTLRYFILKFWNCCSSMSYLIVTFQDFETNKIMLFGV